MITSVFPAICAADVAASRDFYVELFGFSVVFDSEWYVQLHAPTDPHVQLGIVDRQHESVHRLARTAPAGVFVSIEVPDVDAVHTRATELGLPIHVTLRSETFGQRHFTTADPDGLLVDVITPIEFAEEHLDALHPGHEGR